MKIKVAQISEILILVHHERVIDFGLILPLFLLEFDGISKFFNLFFKFLDFIAQLQITFVQAIQGIFLADIFFLESCYDLLLQIQIRFNLVKLFAHFASGFSILANFKVNLSELLLTCHLLLLVFYLKLHLLKLLFGDLEFGFVH